MSRQNTVRNDFPRIFTRQNAPGGGGGGKKAENRPAGSPLGIEQPETALQLDLDLHDIRLQARGMLERLQRFFERIGFADQALDVELA